MFNRDGIRTLHGVTHDRLDLLLDHVAKLPPADFVREIPGFGFASVRDQLAHLLGAEERWGHRLQHLPLPRWVPADYPAADWHGDLRSPAFILHHVITHAYHHKGQVVAMCRLLGHPAPDTDLQN